MAEKPILFSGPMVRALLDGRKTMTRRVVKPQPSEDWEPFSYGEVHKMVNGSPNPEQVIGWGPCNEWGDEAYPCPYGAPGDKLWVRETWRADDFAPNDPDGTIFRADGTPDLVAETHGIILWRPSIFMPRNRSRITLEIVGVRVEQVQEISGRDARAEGVATEPSAMPGVPGLVNSARPPFIRLWDSINAQRGFGWESNCWVWVIEFKRISQEQPPQTGAKRGGQS